MLKKTCKNCKRKRKINHITTRKQRNKPNDCIKHISGGNLDENIKNTLELKLRSKEENLSKMLKVTCKNSDNCLTLGYYGDIIKNFFNNFTDFSYVEINNIKQIGEPSGNGFIVEIPFEKNGYKAYTVLKCSSMPDSDNLFYEYYVGKYFINKYIKKFPCFVETYNCYEFKNNSYWQMLKNNNLSFSNLNDLLRLKHINETDYNMFGESCVKNKRMCILMQHFDKFNTFENEYVNNFKNIKFEIINILYQVYYPLVCLKNKYTHYDLHRGNVCLYKPYDGKQYIKMRYHRRGVVSEFPSEYVVKIIDYGRNYFKNDNTSTLDLLRDHICPSAKCEPNCGNDVGYGMIQGDLYNNANSLDWTTPNKPNESHDLKFAYRNSFYLNQILNKEIVYRRTYGTPPVPGNHSDKIYNIYDLFRNLEYAVSVIQNTVYKLKYDKTWKCVASMDIYDDGREYEFKIITPPKEGRSYKNCIIS
jgi:hypothetical protein